MNWRKRDSFPSTGGQRYEPIDQAAQEDEAILRDLVDDKNPWGYKFMNTSFPTGYVKQHFESVRIDMSDISRLAASDKELRNRKLAEQLSGRDRR